MHLHGATSASEVQIFSNAGLSAEPESSKEYAQGWPGVLQKIKQASEA